MSSALNESSNVVLKLSLGEGDECQVRRIVLGRLWENGKASYARLVALALEYSLAEAVAKEEKEEVDVVITYSDEDGDLITISSDEELADAFGQFVETKPPVLRVKGKIVKTERKHKPAAPQTKPATPQPEPAAACSHSSSFPPPPRTAPQIQALLESLVSILASAVLTLQDKMSREGNNPFPSTNTAVPSTQDTQDTSTAAHKDLAKETAENIMKDVVSKIALAKSTDDSAKLPKRCTKHDEPQKTPTSDTSTSTRATSNTAASNTTSSFAPKPATPTKPSPPPQTQTKNKQPEEQPFVHGRHTCDGCLATPIIGTRYHAKNLPDYDLCANCFQNYKGTDIQFQPETLDRDRCMQHRWARRQARRLRQSRFTGEYPGQCRVNRRRMREQKTQEADFETSLKEAIRRSLEGVEAKKKEVAIVKEEMEKKEDEKEEKPKVELELLMKEENAAQQEVVEKKEATVEKTVEDMKEEIIKATEKMEEVVPKTEVKPTPTEKQQEEIVEQVEELEDTKPAANTTAQIEITETTEEPEKTSMPQEPTSPNTSYFSEAKECGSIAEALGDALDNVAHAIDEIHDQFEGSDISIQEASQDDAASEVSDEDSVKSEGIKIDAIGDSISAMTCSVDTSGTAFGAVEEAQAAVEVEEEDNEPEIVSAPEVEIASEEPEVATEAPQEEESTAVEGGATILGSIGTDTAANNVEQSMNRDTADEQEDEESTKSGDDWDVIDEADDVQEQIANDEALARAASLIGSALFQSDLSNSLLGRVDTAPSAPERETSTSTVSTSTSTNYSSSSSSSNSSVSSTSASIVSLPSSVGSNVPSISTTAPAPTAPSNSNLSSAVLHRWGNELSQLRELGFMDDVVNVDALEALQAANIGAGSDDVVSLNDAVLRILSNN
eukprot:CAMPEP_0185726104 /NCGR_PEP_ID=MMETSP1171-20130828/2179_1 /TAXON_ID=374046 /ORGANISM="Helicotheca tamensis, Strain CCMP826" /LENGTH=896 /DNA_ID=CAMNT_0028394385 /DNA_START=17 /DNA_END=2707 /DNA_ORIENTATION=+